MNASPFKHVTFTFGVALRTIVMAAHHRYFTRACEATMTHRKKVNGYDSNV
jgi:hypothetical protein